MGSESSKIVEVEEEIAKIKEKTSYTPYQPPKIIPFPHKNEKRWHETVEALKQESVWREEYSELSPSFSLLRIA